MPTYAYKCKSCSYHFEVFQRMGEAPLTSCPKCGKEIRRIIGGGGGIIFKGAGFYATDSRAAGETKKEKPGEPGIKTACDSCPHNKGAGESSIQEKTCSVE